jgi:hypothetical protein
MKLRVSCVETDTTQVRGTRRILFEPRIRGVKGVIFGKKRKEGRTRCNIVCSF